MVKLTEGDSLGLIWPQSDSFLQFVAWHFRFCFWGEKLFLTVKQTMFQVRIRQVWRGEIYICLINAYKYLNYYWTKLSSMLSTPADLSCLLVLVWGWNLMPWVGGSTKCMQALIWICPKETKFAHSHSNSFATFKYWVSCLSCFVW